jgi:glycosyltransferase involved in cell wall biosynthesis
MRALSFLSFMTSSVLAGLRVKSPDLIMGTTPPIFQAVSAWLLSVVRRKPLLLEVRDLWPEFAIDIGLLRSPILIKASRWLEAFLYAHADHLLVNSPAYRDYLIRKGIPPQKVSFIANGVDPLMFNPDAAGDAFRAQTGCRDKFVAVYAGAIGMANDIEVLVSAAEILCSRNDIAILIVGDGKERPRLVKEAADRGLQNIVFIGAMPKSAMNEVLAGANACIAILRDIPMFTTTYPNKVFDYMAAGRPTILAIDGVIRRVIEESQGGIFVAPGNPQKMAEAIVQLANNPESAKAMGRSARQYVMQHFNRDEQAREFENLLVRVTGGTGSETGDRRVMSPENREDGSTLGRHSE